jgi:hypothetical protein
MHSAQSQSNFLLIGDFNLPCISWNEIGPTHNKIGHTEAQTAGIKLTDELSFLGLKQYNTLKNHAGNTLDLAFSNLTLSVTQVCVTSYQTRPSTSSFRR